MSMPRRRVKRRMGRRRRVICCRRRRSGSQRRSRLLVAQVSRVMRRRASRPSLLPVLPWCLRVRWAPLLVWKMEAVVLLQKRALRPVFPKVLAAMPFSGVNSLAACLTAGFWGALRKVHRDDAGDRARVSSCPVVSRWRRERAEKWAGEAPKTKGLNNRPCLKRASEICAQKGVGFTRIVFLSSRSRCTCGRKTRPAARRTVVDGWMG